MSEDILIGLTYDDSVYARWVNLGEGLAGDYNPDDPDDENLLRFDVIVTQEFADQHDIPHEPTDRPGWVAPLDNSYCTQVPADTPENVLIQLLGNLAKDAYHAGEDLRRRLEELSWMQADEVASGGDLRHTFDLGDGATLQVVVTDEGIILDAFAQDGQQHVGTRADLASDLFESLTEGLRSCDECGRMTDAGEFPDWVDGVCETCDPSVLDHPENVSRKSLS